MNRANPIVDFAAKGYESRGKRIFAPKVGEAPSLVAGSSRNLLSPSALEELFLFQRTANGAGGTGAAVFQSIKGNSIVWNQLLPDLAEPIAFPAQTSTTTLKNNMTLVNGHKYMLMAELSASVTQSSNDRFTLSFNSGYPITTGMYLNNERVCRRIFTYSDATATADLNLWITNYPSQVSTDVKVLSVNLIDLTLSNMSVTSVSDFTKFYNLPYYAPNPGAILNNAATGMVTDGFNQWDEEILYNQQWEGTIGGTAALVNYEGRQCNKNLIPVIPGQSYCIKLPTTGLSFYLYYYDSSYILMERPYVTQSGGYYVFNIPSNVSFLAFTILYTQTYANNICINLSGARNGEYEPHWSDTCALPITTATGKLNGAGESVVITPNGLAGVGTSFDEAIVEKGMWTKDIIRMFQTDNAGALSWESFGQLNVYFVRNLAATTTTNIILVGYTRQATSSALSLNDKCFFVGGGNIYVRDTDCANVAAFKAALANKGLVVEAATPKEYILDTPVPVVARVDEDGTQTITPQGVDESGVPMTAPFAASIFYPEQMDKVYLTAADFKNFLDAAVSGGAITAYTMEWNAATGSYDFTVNQAAATLAAPASTE